MVTTAIIRTSTRDRIRVYSIDRMNEWIIVENVYFSDTERVYLDILLVGTTTRTHACGDTYHVYKINTPQFDLWTAYVVCMYVCM